MKIEDLNPLEIKDLPPDQIVTVIFFSFRRPMSLKKTIDGFLQSTSFKGLWLIIMDCASTPETSSYITSIMPHCGAVFMTPTGYGLGRAMKIAINYTMGNHIVFLDDDLTFIVGPDDPYIEEGIDILQSFPDRLCSINLVSLCFYNHIGDPPTYGDKLITPKGTTGYIFQDKYNYKTHDLHLIPMHFMKEWIPKLTSELPENEFKGFFIDKEIGSLDRPDHGVVHPIHPKDFSEYETARAIPGIRKVFVSFSMGFNICKD